MPAASQILCALFLLVTMGMSVPPAYSKGIPDKIVIKGARMRHGIEITDREILKNFDAWSAQFIDWTREKLNSPSSEQQSCKAVNLATGQESLWKIVEPATTGDCYDVFIYMKWKGRHSIYDQGSLKMIYSFRYCVSADGDPGYIYLPGRSDKLYAVNGGTILRDQLDGRWHYASSTWSAVMKKAGPSADAH
jgi:hypothetical protein